MKTKYSRHFIYKNTNNSITIREAFKMVFKNSIFIAFSFVNLFIPFFATMMSALDGPNGALNVIGVGLTTSFITIFNQFLFLIAMISVYILKQNNRLVDFESHDVMTLWVTTTLYALVAAILFIATSFLYIHFSSIYQNITSAIVDGYKYASIIIPSLFFNAIIYLQIFIKREEHKWLGYTILGLLLVFNLIFIPVIGIVPEWSDSLSTFGIGLGITVSSILAFLVILMFSYKHFRKDFHFNEQHLIFILKKTKNFSLSFLLTTIMKSILVMAIAISLSLNAKETPPALMLTKIIWYNSLFFCGWFADGLMYSIQYTRINAPHSLDDKPNYKIWTAFILLACFVTTIISVLFAYISMQLPNLYVSHQYNTIPNPLNIAGTWPYGNLSPKEIQAYLWSPTTGVCNFNFITISSNHLPEYNVYSKSFALLYVTLYHIVVNSTKIMGISDIEFDQKFNVKGLITQFILISIVMIFIVVFSIVGGDNNEQIKLLFPGIDAFSFSLLIIISFLFVLTLLGYLGKIKKASDEAKGIVKISRKEKKLLAKQAKLNKEVIC